MRLRIPYWHFLILPSLFMGVGLLLNAFVVAMNGHTMPVLAQDCLDLHKRISFEFDDIHSCMTRSTKYKLLADWFYIPGIGTASIGDFFEWLSEVLYLPALYMWIALVIKDHNNRD